MKRYIPVLITVLAIGLLSQTAQAQTALQTMKAAIDFRAAMAVTVARNGETPESAIQRLGKVTAVSGLSSRGAVEDQAYAALDIAYRLLALERPDAAEWFFLTAEAGFERATQGGALSVKDRAEGLKLLGTIRGRYLNKPMQAKADIEAAARLQPDDKIIAVISDELKWRREGVMMDKRKN